MIFGNKKIEVGNQMIHFKENMMNVFYNLNLLVEL